MGTSVDMIDKHYGHVKPLQAHMWFSLAAARGGGDYAKVRDQVAKLMTPAQIAEAQRLAREWKPRGRSGAAPDN